MDWKPEASNIAKDIIGEGKVELFGNLVRGVGRYNVADRQCTPMISTLLAMLAWDTRGKPSTPFMACTHAPHSWYGLYVLCFAHL